jgi:nucleoid-associated protein YgaU
MLSRTTAIWAGATGAVIVVAGAAAAYWTYPSFLFPPPPPAASAETSAAPASTAAAAPAVAAAEIKAPAPAAAVKPAFDVVNVDPAGETVVAGHAAPNARIELRDAGKTVAETTANSAGQFVVIPPALTPGPHSLTLAAPGEPAETSNAIEVAVAAPESRPAAAPVPAKAAAATPSSTSRAAPPPAATASLAARPPAAPPSPAAAPPAAPRSLAPAPAAPLSVAPAPAAPPSGSPARVAVQSVEARAGGRLVAKGAASPNATVRLYLSGAFVGDAQTKDDGRWTLTIKHGLTPGAYALRADEINPKDAAVLARAEVPFDYAVSSSDPSRSLGDVAEAEASRPAPSTADVIVEAVQTHHVAPGHTLWGISQKFYGDGTLYKLIFAANANQIKNPNLIYPGQIFVVPGPKP